MRIFFITALLLLATTVLHASTARPAPGAPRGVRIFDCGLLEDGRPWIAMELVMGESLAAKLERQHRLSPKDVVSLVTHLPDVLTTVHAHGIVHRDLKPDNILFADAGPGSAYPLRVID